MDGLWELILNKANYWMTIALMMVGLYAMITKRNLVKKIIGMNILQTAVILMFISIGAKRDATIPILQHVHGGDPHGVHAVDYINPLPHVLMLTAIVVAVSTLGVALALIINIFQYHGTLDEAEILSRQVPESRGGRS